MEWGAKWLELLSSWEVFEASLTYGGSSHVSRVDSTICSHTECHLPIFQETMPVKNRPAEWYAWISSAQNGVRPHNKPPFIQEPEDLGIAIRKWWDSLKNGSNAVGDRWVKMKKPGPQGFISLLMLMLWWRRAFDARQGQFDTDCLPMWTALVDEMSEALTWMNAAPIARSAPSKRPRQGETPLQPKKRCVIRVVQLSFNLTCDGS